MYVHNCVLNGRTFYYKVKFNSTEQPISVFKPIFHCDATALRWSSPPQRQNFALGIPTCWYLKSRKFALPRTRNPNPKQHSQLGPSWAQLGPNGGPPWPNRGPTGAHMECCLGRQSVEYRLRWIPNAKFSRWPCTFLFFGVLISFALGPVFQWNMGLKMLYLWL